MEKAEILENVYKLYDMWKDGKLGGEFMPEDSNPHFERNSTENYVYFTLPMALNYQRNSYKLWESALETINDDEIKFVFDIQEVLKRDKEQVKDALTKYRVALQRNKQTEIWLRLCKTINDLFEGDIRKLFKICDFDVNKIRTFIQSEHKKEFPYLSGNKICNYWLFVLYQYTDIKFKNIQDLTVAPDTHVVKATRKLGLITDEEFKKSDVQLLVIERWKELLKGAKIYPIDIHTPLWLWSRTGFKEIE